MVAGGVTQSGGLALSVFINQDHQANYPVHSQLPIRQHHQAQLQDRRHDDERHDAPGQARHQQHQPGRRGEAEEDVAPGPPTARQALPA